VALVLVALGRHPVGVRAPGADADLAAVDVEFPDDGSVLELAAQDLAREANPTEGHQ
jgi:hypothetical protein